MTVVQCHIRARKRRFASLKTTDMHLNARLLTFFFGMKREPEFNSWMGSVPIGREFKLIY